MPVRKGKNRREWYDDDNTRCALILLADPRSRQVPGVFGS